MKMTPPDVISHENQLQHLSEPSIFILDVFRTADHAGQIFIPHRMPLKQISQRATLIDSMPLTEPHALSVSGSLPLSVSVALCLSLSVSLCFSLYLSLSVSLCTSLSVSVAEKRLGSTVLEYCMEIVFKI